MAPTGFLGWEVEWVDLACLTFNFILILLVTQPDWRLKLTSIATAGQSDRKQPVDVAHQCSIVFGGWLRWNMAAGQSMEL